MKEEKVTDLGKDKIGELLLKLALPAILAQIINVLYNMVDRMYIGHIPKIGSNALTGVGVTMPVIMAISAFAALVSMGGAPRASIMMGKNDKGAAEKILGNCTLMLVIMATVLTFVFFVWGEDILLVFGASSKTIGYALEYMKIYSLGTIFVQLALGLNAFINAQGYAKIGMFTVAIGAVCNIILDPIFIFGLDLGVKGAAFATVISQFISALWTLRFLTGKKTILKIKKQYLSLKVKYVTKIISLGMAGFMMAITNSIVTIVCNATLQQYGGDLYIAIMTIINSIREVASLPGQGMANACQPVLGFNYGAKEYARVLQGIKFVTLTALSMMLIVWLAITVFPELFIKIFSHNQEIITHGVSALRLYFFGFFMMSFQMTGQAAAVGLGKSKQAVFFSIFRKVIIVAPLTVILPIYIGIDGVFIAEAISNFIGGGACYITMWFTIAKKLKSGIISE